MVDIGAKKLSRIDRFFQAEKFTNTALHYWIVLKIPKIWPSLLVSK